VRELWVRASEGDEDGSVRFSLERQTKELAKNLKTLDNTCFILSKYSSQGTLIISCARKNRKLWRAQKFYYT
jgi:hypothetical protein